MLDFQQKWKFKSFMYSKGVRIFLGILALYSLFSAYTVYQKKRQSDIDVHNAELRLLALSAKESVLLKEIDHLQTDEGLEEEIRSKYSVAKEKEKVVVLVEDEVATTTTVAPKKNIWARVGEFFGF